MKIDYVQTTGAVYDIERGPDGTKVTVIYDVEGEYRLLEETIRPRKPPRFRIFGIGRKKSPPLENLQRSERVRVWYRRDAPEEAFLPDNVKKK